MVVDVGRTATEEDATAVEVLVATTVAVLVLVGLELAEATTAEEVARTEVEVARTEVDVARTEVDGSSEVDGRAVWETVAQMLEPTTEAAMLRRWISIQFSVTGWRRLFVERQRFELCRAESDPKNPRKTIYVQAISAGLQVLLARRHGPEMPATMS